MADNSKLLNAICELVEVPAGSLDAAASLDGLENWNSLSVLGFLAYVDENYGVALSPEKITACKTVDDLLNLVAQSK